MTEREKSNQKKRKFEMENLFDTMIVSSHLNCICNIWNPWKVLDKYKTVYTYNF